MFLLLGNFSILVIIGCLTNSIISCVKSIPFGLSSVDSCFQTTDFNEVVLKYLNIVFEHGDLKKRIDVFFSGMR